MKFVNWQTIASSPLTSRRDNGGILKEADTAFSMMDTMDEVVSEQTNAVDNTAKTFNVIATNIENIINRINDISESIAIMEKDKDDVTYAMQNISAVSEEAASSQKLPPHQEQKNSIVKMVASSRNLNQLSLELRKHVEYIRSSQYNIRNRATINSRPFLYNPLIFLYHL